MLQDRRAGSLSSAVANQSTCPPTTACLKIVGAGILLKTLSMQDTNTRWYFYRRVIYCIICIRFATVEEADETSSLANDRTKHAPNMGNPPRHGAQKSKSSTLKEQLQVLTQLKSYQLSTFCRFRCSRLLSLHNVLRHLLEDISKPLKCRP